MTAEVEQSLRNIVLPHITPHVFRHTFCTNLANAGMDAKNLQYLMGHSEAGVTLNVYTHANYDKAAEQLRNVADFGSARRNAVYAKSDAKWRKIGLNLRRHTNSSEMCRLGNGLK